jgi:hypothetical protein
MQINQTLEKMNGIFLVQERENIQMGLDQTEQLFLGIGKQLEQINQYLVVLSILGLRKLWFFTKVDHQRELKQIGLCMNIG